MSSPVCLSPYRKISPAMWRYIGEGDYNKYCGEHNLSLTTFYNKFKLYNQSTDKGDWSPTSKG